MSQVPARYESQPAALEAPSGPGSHDEPRLGRVWSILRRNILLIMASALVTTAAAAYFTSRTTPIYRAVATLRIDPENADMEELFRALSGRGDITTEMAILSSRTLLGDAVRALGLQLRLVKPTRLSRAELFGNVTVSDSASPGEYLLQLGDHGGWAVLTADSGAFITHAVGDTVAFGGVSFRVMPAATAYETIQFAIRPFEGAVDAVSGGLTVTQSTRGASVVEVEYLSSDPQLVWQVPNLIVERFVARRQDALKTEARSSVVFLREQLKRVESQLAESEETFRTFRERNQLLNPQVEANGQVARRIQKESERSSLEAERSALAKSLQELDLAAARQPAGSPSPYRQLLAFPTLLRNQAAAQLLSTLAGVEEQRTDLLGRRTSQDQDVQILTTRMVEIEQQLRSIAETYLHGLNNQIASMDSSLASFGRDLDAIPRKELQFARLERQTKGLDEIYRLLQTRLQEAEIAQAIEDPSVRVVDAATPPGRPIKPNPQNNLLVGLLLGIGLGVTIGLVREYMDVSIHTRGDVIAATGLPVMGLIPRIRGRKKIALVTDGRVRDNGSALRAAPPPAVPPPASRPPQVYTFLQTVQSEENDGPLRSPTSPHDLHAPPLARRRRLVVSSASWPVAEAYGVLQTNIVFSRVDTDIKTVVLTSPLSGDGKTTCAVNLAVALAERGLKALLIDADLRRGSVHTVFEDTPEPGLSDVLAGTATVQQAIRAVGVGSEGTLYYLPTGTHVQNPSMLLASEQLRTLLGNLREEYDSIVIDSPPINILTDAALLGVASDGVLIVARAGVTEAGALSHSLEQLRHVRAPVIGVVLNDIDFKRDAVYDASYKAYNSDPYVRSRSK